MKIYQCVHKYPPHIPAFERRWGIGDHSTFAEIHDALLRDGYASVYRLVPPLECSGDNVFFTVWNYERLQFTWARENGVENLDLDEIRLKQIEKLKPDVVYDFSYFISPKFAELVKSRLNVLTVCWYAFVNSKEPPIDIPYTGLLSLHRPYIDFWKSKGIQALELQPAIEDSWSKLPFKGFKSRKHDLLFYGQINTGLYDDRTNVIMDALQAAKSLDIKFTCLAQYRPQYWRPGGLLARFGLNISMLQKWPSRELSRSLGDPKYGRDLYDEIRNSKIVLNTFGDFNGNFKSNMRIFEAIGNGSILLSPKGVYPDNLIENKDYIPFESAKELEGSVREIFEDISTAENFCATAQRRVFSNFSKKEQYTRFCEFIEKL